MIGGEGIDGYDVNGVAVVHGEAIMMGVREQ